MSAHTEEHLDLCAEFKLGALEPWNETLLMDHLRGGCTTCDAALARWDGAVLTLANASPVAFPKPEMSERMLAELAGMFANDKAAAPMRTAIESRSQPIMTWRGWVAVWVAFILGVGVVMARNETAIVRKELADARGMLGSLSRQWTDAQRWDSVISAPGARHAVLTSVAGAASPIAGWITLDPASRRMVGSLSDARPPAGRAYRLWAVHGGSLEDLGPLLPDAGGRAAVRVKAPMASPMPEGVAISLEPASAGTSLAAPSGTPVASATLR